MFDPRVVIGPLRTSPQREQGRRSLLALRARSGCAVCARRHCGLFLATAVCAHAALVSGLLKPLHARGLYQPVTGFLNGLNSLLLFPGWLVTHYYALHLRPHRPWLLGLIDLGINLSLYFCAGSLMLVMWKWAKGRGRLEAVARPRRGHDGPTGAARDNSRRRFLAAGLTVAAGSTLAGCGYGLVAEPRRFVVTHRVFPIRGLPQALDGLRAVQLTDIHHGPWLARAYVRQVVQASNELRPDLVFLTGDYVNESPVYFRPVIEELARLRPRIGTLAVLGNHDWWEGAALARQEFDRAGIPLIDHGRRVLTPDRRLVSDAGEGLALCGVGDLWEDRPRYRPALGGLPGAMPRLLLSHNPDVAEEPELVRSGLRVDLMISGHTHGGQIRLPGLGTPIVPSRYGQKYAQGLVRGPVCPVFVCRGIGVSLLPLRIGVPPEIAVLEFRAQAAV